MSWECGDGGRGYSVITRVPVPLLMSIWYGYITTTMLELKLSQRWPASQLMSLNYHSPSQSHWIIGDGCGGATSENWINLYMKRDSEAQNENVWNIVATQIDVQKLCAELLTCTH